MNNPIIVIIAIGVILLLSACLVVIITLKGDLECYKERLKLWKGQFDFLDDLIITIAFSDISFDLLEKLKNHSNLQLIGVKLYRLQTENEKLKAHIQLLLNRRD